MFSFSQPFFFLIEHTRRVGSRYRSPHIFRVYFKSVFDSVPNITDVETVGASYYPDT